MNKQTSLLAFVLLASITGMSFANETEAEPPWYCSIPLVGRCQACQKRNIPKKISEEEEEEENTGNKRPRPLLKDNDFAKQRKKLNPTETRDPQTKFDTRANGNVNAAELQYGKSKLKPTKTVKREIPEEEKSSHQKQFEQLQNKIDSKKDEFSDLQDDSNIGYGNHCGDKEWEQPEDTY